MKPMDCFSCQHSQAVSKPHIAGVSWVHHLACAKGHTGTPRDQSQCADFAYEPGTDATERRA